MTREWRPPESQSAPARPPASPRTPRDRRTAMAHRGKRRQGPGTSSRGAASHAALAQAPAAGVTAFEGARLIVGDGSAPIENATLIVDGARIVQAGAAAGIRVPDGATRVNVAGKTVMPMLIDTHVHLSPTRE